MFMAVLAVVFGLYCYSSLACTMIVVGKKASSIGASFIGYNADGMLGNHPVHFLNHQARSESFAFKAFDNNFTYNMPAGALSYTGFPEYATKGTAYEKGGFNSNGVGMVSMVEVVAKQEVLNADPYEAVKGIMGDSLASVILPQINSARHGVELLGSIIESIGAGQGFAVAFSDKNEAWYLESVSGHQWVAVKVPDDKYFVVANQLRIRDVDPGDKDNVLASKGLINFAIKHGLAKPRNDGKIDVFKAYALDDDYDIKNTRYRVKTIQGIFNAENIPTVDSTEDSPVFLQPDRPLGVIDVQTALQNHYQGSFHDPYTTRDPETMHYPVSVLRAQQSLILQLRSDLPEAIANVHWVALGMPALSFYVPFYYGSHIPEVYQAGTDKADSQSAWWKFRKLQTLVMQDFPKYAPYVKSVYAKLSKEVERKMIDMESDYIKLYASDPFAANKMLVDFNDNIVMQVFDRTDGLLNDVFTQMSIDVNSKYSYCLNC